MRLILFTLLFMTFTHNVFAASGIQADKTAARILVYFTVGRDEAPATNVTLEQFKSHIQELTDGDYTVLPLPKIITAYQANKPLPENTVAITFDGGDKSILKNAVPLLEAHKLPYTVFIATTRANQNDPRYLNWDDIRLMLKSPLFTIGLHPEIYSNISNNKAPYIRSKLNNATSRLRKETSVNTTLFAYPFGENTQNYKNLIAAYGFKAAFGQQSGVAHAGADRFMLPRFTMTENYANDQRFQMTISSLPLPVSDATPRASHILNTQPAIGFTVSDDIGGIHALSCFASGQERPSIDIVGGKRVEIRLKQPIDQTRFRVNCTLPVKEDNGSEAKHWHWFGYLMTLDETTLTTQEKIVQ